MPGKENETLNFNNFKKIGQCLLSFMQILKQEQRRFKHAHQNKINHIQKHIRNAQIVGMFIKLFVFMMRNLTNLCRRKCCLQVYGKDD